MRNLMLALFFNLLAIPLIAQLPPKVANDELFGKDCYYFKQAPKDKIIKGVLVLIPGYGEHPYSVSAQTTILQESENKGITVLIVNLTPNNQNFPIDANSISKLGKMIKHYYAQEKIPAITPLYIGGFSIGGTTALKFFHQQNNEFKISKVFAIDPPLDMVRLRNSLQKGREKNLTTKLDSISPSKELIEGLKQLSVYNPDFTKQEMLPNYTQTALRIYAEPDILWWIKNRSMDLSDMNVTDCAGYVNKLLQKDPNQKIELILTKDKGIRNGNQKHPHSWSIADPIDLINWLLMK